MKMRGKSSSEEFALEGDRFYNVRVKNGTLIASSSLAVKKCKVHKKNSCLQKRCSTLSAITYWN